MIMDNAVRFLTKKITSNYATVTKERRTRQWLFETTTVSSVVLWFCLHQLVSAAESAASDVSCDVIWAIRDCILSASLAKCLPRVCTSRSWRRSRVSWAVFLFYIRAHDTPASKLVTTSTLWTDKHTRKRFCHIFHKTQSILIKFSTCFPD